MLVRFEPVNLFSIAGLALLALGLSGCTATWQAPVETRSKHPVRQVQSVPDPSPQSLIASVYEVRRGDTLIGIAWRAGIDYRVIARWNSIPPPYRIYPGQRLTLRPPETLHRPAHPTDAASSVMTSPVATKAPPVVIPEPKAPTTGRSAPQTQVTPLAKPPLAKPEPPKSRPADAAALSWHWPASGPVSSGFRVDDPTRRGLKIAGRQGDPIRAAEAGTVVYKGSGLIGYGQLIIVKHNDNYLSAYGHNRAMLVEEGAQVTRGQQIAEMGAVNSGQALLHFEIRRDGKPIDPAKLLPRR